MPGRDLAVTSVTPSANPPVWFRRMTGIRLIFAKSPQVLAALSANRDEGHQTRLRQRVASAMARSVLHDAITLAQMDLLSVVQFQRHLATNDDPVIDGVRGVHAGRAAFKMVAHAGALFRHFSQPALERDARRRLVAFGTLGRIRNQAKHRASRTGQGFPPPKPRVRPQALELRPVPRHVEFVERQSGLESISTTLDVTSKDLN